MKGLFWPRVPFSGKMSRTWSLPSASSPTCLPWSSPGSNPFLQGGGERGTTGSPSRTQGPPNMDSEFIRHMTYSVSPPALFSFSRSSRSLRYLPGWAASCWSPAKITLMCNSEPLAGPQSFAITGLCRGSECTSDPCLPQFATLQKLPLSLGLKRVLISTHKALADVASDSPAWSPPPRSRAPCPEHSPFCTWPGSYPFTLQVSP